MAINGMFDQIIFFLCYVSITGEVLALCTQGSYLNLCGICVGGTTNFSEVEGLDRCKVCDGLSECVGCDGIINSSFKRDTCGLCLLPQSEQWNDCQKITNVYPSVLDLSLDSNVIPLTITGAGLKRSFINETQCVIQPLKSNSDVPKLTEVNLEENDIQIKLQLAGSTGTYRIGCSEIDGFAELHIVDSRKLNVVKIDPSEILVGQTVEVEVYVEEDYSSKVWCFVKVQGSETITLDAIRKSENSFLCSQYTSVTAGVLSYGVVAFEETAFSDNGTGKTADVVVRAKSPVAEIAEYSPDMRQILIHFDQNIQVTNCSRVFSLESRKSLGHGFRCTTSGDTLYVTSENHFQNVESVNIESDNSVRAWSIGEGYSPNAVSATLPVSKEKVIIPSISLSVPNIVCFNSSAQPNIKVTISKIGQQKLDFKWVVPPLREFRGKNQRENMLMWKNVRTMETELNTMSRTGNFTLSRRNILRGFHYAIILKYGNGFNKQDEVATGFKISETDDISVMVTAFPSASAIVAQADITFCATDLTQTILKYRWSVDEKIVTEDGNLLHIPGANPGIHTITCTVLDQSSGRIMGKGWTSVKVMSLKGQTVIFPSEIVVGTMDEITLRVHSVEAQIHWSCATSNGEPCIILGPKADPIDEVINVTSPVLHIPPGTLPVGRYTWTLQGFSDLKSTVIISPRIPPNIKVLPPPPLIDSTKQFSLNADVKRLKPGCMLRWKVVRKRGYDHFDLHEDVGLGDLIRVRSDDLLMEEREASLIIPTARGRWRGLAEGRMYLFRLETLCPEPVPEAHVDVTVMVNNPPTTPDISITPDIGEAINTRFDIHTLEATDSLEDHPLLYRVSCKDESNEEISLGTQVFNIFKVYLPPGNITLILRICDIRDSCSISTRTITVNPPSEISSETIKNIKHEIKQLMLSGDTATAYGKAIIALKSLSIDASHKQKLNEIFTAIEAAMKEKLEDLTKRLNSNPKLIKSSFQFLEQSVANLKYFSETKAIVKLLTEFKNVITKSTLGRSKRDSFTYSYRIRKRDVEESGNAEIGINTIKAIFDLHGKILEQNSTIVNREEFLKDVKKYMIATCNELQDSAKSPVLIESSIVILEVLKLAQKDMKNDIALSGSQNTKIKFNLKTLPRKTCIAIATYKEDFLGNTSATRFTDVYEVRLVTNGTTNDNFREIIKSITFTIPLRNATPETTHCMAWKNEWKPVCVIKTITNFTITCGCKDSGIIAAFFRNETLNGTSSSEAKIPSTASVFNTTTISPMTTVSISTTHFNSNIVETTAPAIVAPAAASTLAAATTLVSRNIVSNETKPVTVSTISEQTNTGTTMFPYKKTTERNDLVSVIQNISKLRDKHVRLFVSGTFKINEDYGMVVGKNLTGFKDNLRMQIADQLKIPISVIANLIIHPGSIIVSLLFADTEETKAEMAIKELLTKLHDGTLRLIGPDSRVLHIPPQELKIKVGNSSMKNTGKMRIIAYGLVALTLFVIFILAVTAVYLKRKRTRMPLRLPQLSIDDHPTYRQFHNEFSLDGSSASLARYRRTHPFETETPQ